MCVYGCVGGWMGDSEGVCGSVGGSVMVDTASKFGGCAARYMKRECEANVMVWVWLWVWLWGGVR